MGAGRHNKRTDGNKPARSLPDNSLSTQEKNELAFPVLTARSKTSRSPPEGTRPTRFPRKSACIVGPVPSPGGFFNRLLSVTSRGGRGSGQSGVASQWRVCRGLEISALSRRTSRSLDASSTARRLGKPASARYGEPG